MIVKHYDFKKNLLEKFDLYLLYGSNVGLINETTKNLLIPFFSKNIYQYDEIEVLDNEDGFKESLFNKSFFDDHKLIIINRATDKILNIIEDITLSNLEGLKIILKSGNLEKKSKLRNFFEKNKNIIIAPFYDDAHATLMSIAQNYFKEKKIKISSQSISYIIERTKGSRINLRNELEKIENFSRKKLSIGLDEIIKLTNLSENYNVSELTDQCLAKNKKKTLNILNENNSSPEDNILIIKTFLYKLKRLKRLKIDLEIKKNYDAVITSFRPPIFWKDKEIIKQQLKIWSLPQIKSLIKKLNNIELLIKKNSLIASQVINNFILEKVEVSSN